MAAASLIALAAWVLWPAPAAPPVPESRLETDPTLGPTTAQVTVVEYADFGCPSCRAWHNAGILNRIRQRYGERVRFVWRDFPVITAQSPKAAEAGQCAFDQGAFWPYHDLLYDRAPALGIGALKSYAADLGLDQEAFDRCLDSSQHEQTVRRDWQDALERGFRGTPTFVVNGEVVVGPLTFERAIQLIDTPLQEKSG